MENNHHQNNESEKDRAEVAIVGAGPLGIEMAAVLKREGVDYLHFEAGQIGHTLTWWPRQTYFFSTTERIELAGIPIQNTDQQRTTGEEYLAYLRAIVEQLDLPIHAYEPVTDIQPEGEGYRLTTQPQTGPRSYWARKVILALGDMDFPNYLDIPGEDLPHVSHYFTDPHTYFQQRLLIVGGRNSAAEAALRCFRAGARVTISYRRAEFDPKAIKHWILPDLEAQIKLGTIGFLPQTEPVEIQPGKVILKKVQEDGSLGERLEVETDFVLLTTGFVGDARLLEAAGVRLVGPERAPEYNPETMETNVPGIYVCGVVAAGTQSNYRLFIENCHEHVGKISEALTGRWPAKLGTVASRRYESHLEEIRAD